MNANKKNPTLVLGKGASAGLTVIFNFDFFLNSSFFPNSTSFTKADIIAALKKSNPREYERTTGRNTILAKR